MKERPILFSGEMVRAILEGRKTQTRRIVKPQPTACEFMEAGKQVPPRECSIALMRDQNGKGWLNCGPFKYRYGQPGDQLWVREKFRVNGTMGGPRITYAADDALLFPTGCPDNCPDWIADDNHWRPSIFMRRYASRITLEITGVRVERLNDISDEDALAEGIERIQAGEHLAWRNYRFKTAHPRRGETLTDEEHRLLGYKSPCASYKSLWESINGTGSWAQNPWVWVIEFKRIEPNET